MNAIFKRRSYRKFLDRVVEDEKIEKILRAAMQAPSACDQRPWEFLVVTNREKLDELAMATPYSMCVGNCNVAIVPCYRVKGIKSLDYVICDMSACVENILLEAEELGLGAVWIGGAPVKERIDKMRNVLNVDDSLVPFCIIPLGYPSDLKENEDRFDENRVHFIK